VSQVPFALAGREELGAGRGPPECHQPSPRAPAPVTQSAKRLSPGRPASLARVAGDPRVASIRAPPRQEIR